MKNELDRDISLCVRNFHLPSYSEIPDVGLYLEQTVKYVNSFLAPFPGIELTHSMVSNYVKKGILPNAVRKLYGREQIASLIYIAVVKVSLSMENIRLMFRLQRATYAIDVAYEYFRLELENVLAYVFGLKDELENIGEHNTEQKFMLCKAIITAAHKLYLEQYFSAIGDSTDE